MKKETKKYWLTALTFLGVFLLWTILLLFVDVKAIGPEDSMVGFSSLNLFFHKLTGVNLTLYTITDYLGLIPILFALSFAILGLLQWIKRKKIQLVDKSILLLGGLYLTTILLFLLFETVVINYRPILIDGILEASYPSSTTLLTMCVMPSGMIELHERIQCKVLRRIVIILISAFTFFMVGARLYSGVHWFSDIIGGILLSAGLVILFSALSKEK